MFTLKVENSRGEIYELTHDRKNYTVLNITGLTLPHCNVNTSPSGNHDGDVYNSSHLEKRNLVITLALEGDIEASRQQLYRIFPLHTKVKVYFKNRNRDVTIDGYVETIDGDLFAMRETMQVSLICPDPYWQDLNDIYCEMGQHSIGFTFPFSIPAEGIVLSGISQEMVHQVLNNGDAAVGFVADVSIVTNDEPTLTRISTQSDKPADLRNHYAMLRANDLFDALDLDTQTVNVYVNGVLKSPETDYIRDLITRADGSKTLWLAFQNGGLTGAKVTVEVITAEGERITDLRLYEETTTITDPANIGQRRAVIAKPSWFSETADKITVSVEGETLTSEQYEIMSVSDTSITFDFAHHGGFYPVTDQSCHVEIIGSTSGIDISGMTFTREAAVWTLNPYCGFILSPELPDYDKTKDIFRIYKGDTLLENTDYVFETVTKSDGSKVTYFYLTDDLNINETMTFETIKSVSGEDIREYTQEQIDSGFLYVDYLRLENFTTGEYMEFPDIQFRPGDRLEISTVAGDLRATVTDSGWMPVGKSLLYEVMRNGSFFKLVPGENRLGFTAGTNADFVSCELRAKQLYGGV